MLKTILIFAALLVGPCAANTIETYYSGTQAGEYNNSGFAIQHTGPGAFGGGFTETVPGLHDDWLTGTVWSFSVHEGLMYGIVQSQALNGEAVQLNHEWLVEHNAGSGPATYLVGASQFLVGENTLAVFFYGPGSLSNAVTLLYASEVPEPGTWLVFASGLVMVGVRRWKS